MSLKSYKSYKESNLVWAKSVPDHWKTVKMKNIFQRMNRPVQEGDDIITAFRDGEVTLRKNRRKEGFTFSAKEIGYQRIHPGDLVVHQMDSFAGAIGISDSLGKASPVYTVCTPKYSDVDPRYYSYLLRMMAFTGYITSLAKGIRERSTDFRWSGMGNQIVLIPTYNEQKEISDFLDLKTREITELISLKQQQIQTLQQYRQSLITETVTKGLDADTPMRDSGVEWIGEIPEHWEVKKIGHLGRLQNGISKPSEEFGHGHPFVSYSDVYKNIELPVNVDGLVNSSKLDRRNYSVEKGDVFFTRTSETIEEIGFTSTCMETIPNATFAGFLIRFRPSKDLEPIFSKYYFRSNIHRRYFVKEMNIVTRASLGQELLRRLLVVIPPKSEQLEIGLYLDDKLSTIYKAIHKINIQIELLQNYRQSLIYEAVTGKIDVRELEVETCSSHPIS